MIRTPDTKDRPRERPRAKAVLARGLFGCKVIDAEPAEGPSDSGSAEALSIFPWLETQRVM